MIITPVIEDCLGDLLETSRPPAVIVLFNTWFLHRYVLSATFLWTWISQQLNSKNVSNLLHTCERTAKKQMWNNLKSLLKQIRYELVLKIVYCTLIFQVEEKEKKKKEELERVKREEEELVRDSPTFLGLTFFLVYQNVCLLVTSFTFDFSSGKKN